MVGGRRAESGAAVADFAMAIVWNLFTQGQIDTHGAFINLRRMMVTPLKVDPEVWTRVGVVRDGRRHNVTRPSAKAEPHGSTRRKRAVA